MGLKFSLLFLSYTCTHTSPGNHEGFKKVFKKLRKNLLPLIQKRCDESKGPSKNPRSGTAFSLDLHVMSLYKKCCYKNKSHWQNATSGNMFSRPKVFRTVSQCSTTFMPNGSFLTFLLLLQLSGFYSSKGLLSQVFTYSKSTIEKPEECVKSIRS